MQRLDLRGEACIVPCTFVLRRLELLNGVGLDRGSVCSLRLFSCSTLSLMLAKFLRDGLERLRQLDGWSGHVAPVDDGTLSASLRTGGAGKGVCSSAAASWTGGGLADF